MSIENGLTLGKRKNLGSNLRVGCHTPNAEMALERTPEPDPPSVDFERQQEFTGFEMSDSPEQLRPQR